MMPKTRIPFEVKILSGFLFICLWLLLIVSVDSLWLKILVFCSPAIIFLLIFVITLYVINNSENEDPGPDLD